MNRRSPSLLAVVSLAALLLIGCVDDSATPIDPAQPTVTFDFTDVTHTMEPTPQMRDAAEAQCLDDPTRTEGYVRAVDPNSDEVLAEITVDCEDVRG